MKKTTVFILSLLVFSLFTAIGFAQEETKEQSAEKTFSGIEFRSLGPSFMSGRIADIAIHPENKHLWYIAAGSGGVWKTENSGTTWEAVFEDQPVYSIGCVSIDPNNPHIVWVGTGENVGGRHVGYGDGIYLSTDDGENWKNMGLKYSQHISKIIVHPTNSDILWVAAQGPLWSKGGERGLYKTTDGGKNWGKTLGDEAWVGVTDIVIDPRNPDRLYAATWQRHRNVASYIGGGPGTAIYRSEDGGESWVKLTEGLPKSNMGKIGLAISPQKPDVVYAAIELDRRSGAVYRSSNRGASWSKQSGAVSGATGPHYYQELYASPHVFDRIYLADVRIQVSDNGGKNFRRLKEEKKHSDNHVIAFRKDEEDYLLVGTDGGVYESFDLAKNWRFIGNLPLTQFYKLAVDDVEPFYNIYGGTQDNGTQGGPVRTDKKLGITNDDWTVVLFADGHQPATEPGNPDILYAEWQEGHLVRIDRTTGEITGIQPQPEEGENYERFNWDAPILVSPHSPSRLYFASQRLWRSDDRGDSWKAISGDLTKNQERMELPIMDKTWSWDSPWDVNAMSNFNTITSLAESPLMEDLIYAGTDDGLIQITENGGSSWTKKEVGQFSAVPETAFVNDIKADLFDANTVYIALDNHKHGDLSPYLLKSSNRGKSWKSITGNLPDSLLVWRFVQDHKNPKLCFIGTEFGIYFTIDGGEKWIKFKGGLPTIPFRDLAIQRRENDLVGASFGRSFYVLDDYSFLRDVSEEQLKNEATLFDTKDAWRYIPRIGKGAQGAATFVAENPAFGAVFTYYLLDGYQTAKSKRQEIEKEKIKNNEEISFPGWEAVEEERIQSEPKIWLTIRDESGELVRKLPGKVTKGFHRIAWDLRYRQKRSIDASRKISKRDYNGSGMGLVQTGTYSVTLSKEIEGVPSPLSEPITFNVVPLRKGVLQGAEEAEIAAFWKKLNNISGEISLYSIKLNKALQQVDAMQLALARSTSQTGELESELHQLKHDLLSIDRQMRGNRSKSSIGEKNDPTLYYRLNVASSGAANSTYGPTATQIRSLELAEQELLEIKADLLAITEQRIPEMQKKLQAAGAPVVE